VLIVVKAMVALLLVSAYTAVAAVDSAPLWLWVSIHTRVGTGWGSNKGVRVGCETRLVKDTLRGKGHDSGGAATLSAVTHRRLRDIVVTVVGGICPLRQHRCWCQAGNCLVKIPWLTQLGGKPTSVPALLNVFRSAEVALWGKE